MGCCMVWQDERSQHKNKAKALKILRARLFEAQRRKQRMEQSTERKGLIGSGDRSERIRTYNFPQVLLPSASCHVSVGGRDTLAVCAGNVCIDSGNGRGLLRPVVLL